MFCPCCKSPKLRYGLPTWMAESLEPNDPGNKGLLQEYQCEACNLAFWITVESQQRALDYEDLRRHDALNLNDEDERQFHEQLRRLDANPSRS